MPEVYSSIAPRSAGNMLIPMTIPEQIDADLKDAMRNKQADKLSVLRMLKAAVKNAAIEKGGMSAVLDDTEAGPNSRKKNAPRSACWRLTCPRP